jgi:hypothetical protein
LERPAELPPMAAHEHHEGQKSYPDLEPNRDT